jgi:hypothetical protein
MTVCGDRMNNSNGTVENFQMLLLNGRPYYSQNPSTYQHRTVPEVFKDILFHQCKLTIKIKLWTNSGAFAAAETGQETLSQINRRLPCQQGGWKVFRGSVQDSILWNCTERLEGS